MTTLSDDRKLLKYHSKNLDHLEGALLHISLAAKLSIRQKNSKQVTIFNRMYAFTLGAWTEVRLLKLLYDAGGFPVPIRQQIEASDTLFDKWVKCIDKAFQHKYGHSPSRLPKTAKMRRDSIVKVMKIHLKPTITIRNKLAHGQWIYPLNGTLTNIEEEAIAALNRQNIMALQYEKSMLNAIASAIHDLVVSKPTFERDFDKHFQKIDDIERDLSTRNYEDYVQKLVQRYERGRQKRTQQARE